MIETSYSFLYSFSFFFFRFRDIIQRMPHGKAGMDAERGLKALQAVCKQDRASNVWHHSTKPQYPGQHEQQTDPVLLHR